MMNARMVPPATVPSVEQPESQVIQHVMKGRIELSSAKNVKRKHFGLRLTLTASS